MNEIKVFENAQFGSMRTMEREGEPWFVAADVCKALEIVNNRDAIARLDEDEKGVASTDTPGGKQEVAIINEPGLYSLVLGSRKPEAKEFKRWVTHEVLPALRQTGEYRMRRDPEGDAIRKQLAEAKALNAKSRQAAMWLKMAEMGGESSVHKQICAAYASKALEGEMVLPLPQVEKTWSAREVGDRYGVSAHRVGRLANAHGLKVSEYGMLVMDKSRNSPKEVESWRYNARGVERIGELLRDEH